MPDIPTRKVITLPHPGPSNGQHVLMVDGGVARIGRSREPGLPVQLDCDSDLTTVQAREIAARLAALADEADQREAGRIRDELTALIRQAMPGEHAGYDVPLDIACVLIKAGYRKEAGA